MSKIEGKYAPQWLMVQRFSSVRTCSPEIFWSPNLNLNSNRTLHSVWKVRIRTEVLDWTSATLDLFPDKIIWNFIHKFWLDNKYMQQVALNHSTGEIAWWDHISIHAHLLTTYLLHFFTKKTVVLAYVILFNLGSSSKFQSHSLQMVPLFLVYIYHPTITLLVYTLQLTHSCMG